MKPTIKLPSFPYRNSDCQAGADPKGKPVARNFTLWETLRFVRESIKKNRRLRKARSLHCKSVNSCFLGNHFEACHSEHSEESQHFHPTGKYRDSSLAEFTVSLFAALRAIRRGANRLAQNDSSFGCGGKAALRYPLACGYALMALMIMVTVLLVTLAAALPSVYQEAQREREEELIFRGKQYQRAIFLFHRQVGRYPTSVKELLKTNGIRFLRRAYPDPMTKTGKWRFIHSTANGILLDSRTQTLMAPPLAPGLPGAASSPTGTQPGGTENQNAASSQDDKKKQKPSPDCQEKGKAYSPVFGAFIVGVASCSDRPSIRVWNRKTRYSDWEFLGTIFQVTALPTSQGVNPNGTSAQPGATGPGMLGQPPQQQQNQNSGFGGAIETPPSSSPGQTPPDQ